MSTDFYRVADCKVAAILVAGNTLALDPTHPPRQVLYATLRRIEAETGLNLSALRAVVRPTEVRYTHTIEDIARALGISIREANARLERLGYQFRNDDDAWELSIKSLERKAAIAIDVEDDESISIHWCRDVIDELREVSA